MRTGGLELNRALELARDQLAAAQRLVAELEALSTAGPVGASPPDLIPLKVAQAEYGVSEKTVRRWATELDLGEKRCGRWFLSRRRVAAYHSALGRSRGSK